MWQVEVYGMGNRWELFGPFASQAEAESLADSLLWTGVWVRVYSSAGPKPADALA